MNGLTTFTNEEFGSIRTVQIDDEPWFAGKDVGKALGYKNPQDAVKSHTDAEDRMVSDSLTVNGTALTLINESGLYSLILSSKLTDAKRFKRWMTSEILPALRKTGKYETATSQRPLTPDDYIRAAAIVATCKNERLTFALQLLEKAGIYIENAPARQKSRDKTSAELINLACNDYGISLRAIGRETGIHANQLGRIRRLESFPGIDRAESIKKAIYKLIPELSE